MVASDLTHNIRVSHIRLAIHLTFAFITFGYIFWVALTLLYGKKAANAHVLTTFRKQAILLLLLLTLQVIYGAFVAGTRAGWTYNTWPKMGNEWLPESIGFAWSKDGVSSLINNLASIQFIHRGLAYILILFIVIYSIKLFKANLNQGQRNATWLLLTGIFMQVILGILTLLLQVPLWLGVLHQAIAFFLFAGVIYLLHRLKFE